MSSQERATCKLISLHLCVNFTLQISRLMGRFSQMETGCSSPGTRVLRRFQHRLGWQPTPTWKVSTWDSWLLGYNWTQTTHRCKRIPGTLTYLRESPSYTLQYKYWRVRRQQSASSQLGSTNKSLNNRLYQVLWKISSSSCSRGTYYLVFIMYPQKKIQPTVLRAPSQTWPWIVPLVRMLGNALKPLSAHTR